MEWDTYLDHLGSDSSLVVAAASGGLEADVPCCEGWTMRDLVGHLGRAFWHMEMIVRNRPTEPPDEEITVPEDRLVDWFEEGASMFVETLAGADPAEPAWTWHEPDQTVGFWYRRMAQEALIHRVDAEQAAGAVSPIDPDFAADGVDEIIKVILTPPVPDWASFTNSGRAVCISIRGRSWSLEEGRFSGTSTYTGNTYEDQLLFVLAGPSPDINTSISGEPVAMDLWLWGRGPLADLSVDGDPALAENVRQAAKQRTS